MSRRVFLKGAATAVPTVAIATSVGRQHRGRLGRRRHHADAGDDEDAGEGRARHLSARLLGDSYYITAIKPWDGKAAKDPAVKALISDGVARLDQNAQRSPQGALRRRCRGKPIAWRCCRTSSRPPSSRRSAATSSSPSTTRKSSGRSSATRAPPPSTAATSTAASPTSTGCRRFKATATAQENAHGKIRSE